MRTTLKAMPWYERLFFGAITGGLTDIAFVIVEGVGAVQDYVDEGGDNLFCAFTVGAWQATKQYLIEKGMGAAMSGVKNYVKNLGDVKATWNATYGEMKDMMLTEVNQVVSAIQYARVRYNGMLTDRLTRAAENKAKIDMAKVKNTPVKSELDEAIQYGEERARQTLDDLDITAWMAKENPTPENIRLLNQLVTRTQRDKQAMFKLKQTVRDTSWDNARSALNNTQFRRYDLVDDMMRSDLAKARNLRPNQVLVKNPTTSNKVELKNGRNVTMDRDSNYYFINEKGQVEYFEQKLTQNLYNKNYYKVCMEDSYGSGPVKIDTTGMTPQQIARVKQLEERLAKNFSQHGADQTVIQDLKWHPESYGEHDLAHVIDKVHQGEKLVNPTKVAEAMMYKGQSRFYDGQKMIAEAKKILDKNERLDMEANGISQLMEGCRQIVKTFELLNSRAVQRGSTQAVDAIPNSLRESVEIMRIMTGFGEANIKEVQRSLANIGQSLELVAQEMYRTVLKMG